jgi:hypothetical protein
MLATPGSPMTATASAGPSGLFDRCKENIMRKPTSLYAESSTMAVGLKAAVVVVVMGVLAATFDHATVHPNINPLRTDHAVPTAYAEASVAAAFVLPEDLRPNEGDATAPVATF